MGGNDIKKNKVLALKALENSKGNITVAAENCGMARQTITNYKKDDPKFSEVLEGIREGRKDWVESKLDELIDGVTTVTYNDKGEPKIYEQPPCKTSIIFFLKTQAKDRGYIERHEHTGKDGKDLGRWDIEIVDPDSGKD